MAVHLFPASPDPADPLLLTWRVGPGLVRTTGMPEPSHWPAPLAALHRDGVLDSIRLSPGHIETRLTAGRSWAECGATVRSALYEVLDRPGGWTDADPAAVQAAADAELAAAVEEILDGGFGDYTASHGGAIELTEVTDGVVSVRLRGTCRSCAAADLTLTRGLAARLRRVPGFVEVRPVG